MLKSAELFLPGLAGESRATLGRIPLQQHEAGPQTTNVLTKTMSKATNKAVSVVLQNELYITGYRKSKTGGLLAFKEPFVRCCVEGKICRKLAPSFV